MNETNSPQPSPEQLLKLLDLQIKNARDQRGKKDFGKNHTVSFAVIGIIVAVGMVALWVMVSYLESMRPQRAGDAPTAAEAQ